MENSHEKIVDFTYCKYCIHRKKKESDTPCDDCLDNPVNTDSRRPLYFKANGLFEKLLKIKESKNE